MHSAGQLVTRDDAELVVHPPIALVVRRTRIGLKRISGKRHGLDPMACARNGQFSAQAAQIGLEVAQGLRRRRGKLGLLPFQLDLEPPGVVDPLR